jgi:hypothetical protein
MKGGVHHVVVNDGLGLFRTARFRLRSKKYGGPYKNRARLW